MAEKLMTLIERLRNPAWEQDATTRTAKLNIEQNRAAMDDAADVLAAIKAILIHAGEGST